AAYFLALAEQAEPLLRGAEATRWLDLLEADRDNLRAALAWFRTRDETELELRLAASLSYFWLWRGPLGEAQRWLQEALARAGSALPERRVEALDAASYHAYKLGDAGAAETFGREELELARSLGNLRHEAGALSNLAN